MNLKDYFKHDFPAALVVFLVALPLCLGIALASGAPLFAGLIAGIVGGIVAGSLSGSSLGVSGPAAGLTAVVLLAIAKLGSYETFLLSVVLAGIMQIVLGFARAGSLGNFFPISVVKGMLAAIGLILILKQVPHAVGFDLDFEGDESFDQGDGQNTFTEIRIALASLSGGAILISVISIAILFIWEIPVLKQRKFFQRVPSPLVLVLVAIVLNSLFSTYAHSIAIDGKHLVSVPAIADFSNVASWISLPDFSMWRDYRVYQTAMTIAIVASLETLLSTEASDNLDPYRRITPLNRELKAQGVANAISGLLGGLPITSVVVRSSTNINAGAKSKASAITHGVILLCATLFFTDFLRLIPLASLAGLLMVVGYKLIKPGLFVEMYRKGISQFLPFMVTIVAVVLTDLLRGVFCGVLVAVFFILKTNIRQSIILVNNNNSYLIKFTKDVSFLNKSRLRNLFQKIPPNSKMVIDGSDSQFVDQDIRETIHNFIQSSNANNILVELKNISLTK